MIYTVTLNPAIDRTVLVDEINEFDVTRVVKTVRDAAGKGINVSKVITSLGGSTIATGFLAGVNGEFIQVELMKKGIKEAFIFVGGETRENIKLIEKKSGKTLEINEAGPTIEPQYLERFIKTLDRSLKKDDILVLSGSVPGGIPVEVYQTLIERYHSLGITTILDTSKELLQKGILGKPTIIKPNRYELELYSGKKLATDQDIVTEALKICHQGIKEVIVTLGKDGAIYVSEERVFRVDSPRVVVQSSVGAGDSFVAGMAYALSEGYDTEKRLKYAASVAGACVMSEGTNPGKVTDVARLFDYVKIKEIEGK
ncbi:MAG: 1-phosphofructokinase [Firmicutes bacterium]|nr:1-phosphofructokinase [Bacillota bacterium]